MKKNIIKGIVLALILLAGLFLYQSQEDKKYIFSGLGEIYEARRGAWEGQRRNRLFFDPETQPPLETTAHFPSANFRFATNLVDQSFFRMKLVFRFADANGVKELQRKSERIHHALNLTLYPYTRMDLEGNQTRVQALVSTVVDRYILSDIKFLYLTEYTVSGGLGEKKTPPGSLLPETGQNKPQREDPAPP